MFRLMFLGCLLLGGWSWAMSAEPAAKTVSLTVDYGDGVRKQFTALPCQQGDTLATVMLAAKAHARGISYKTRGNGATMLLTEIDGLANGTDDKYWLYDVNGKEGDRSFAVVELSPGDAILWRFGKYP